MQVSVTVSKATQEMKSDLVRVDFAGEGEDCTYATVYENEHIVHMAKLKSVFMTPEQLKILKEALAG